MTNTVDDKILIISPMIPRPDRNSGDLRLASLVEVLAATYGITFVSTSYRPGDDAYIAAMERWGVTVHAERFSLLKLLDSTRFRFAIIEFYFMAEHYLDRIRLRQPECLVVIDSVDLHYLRMKLKYSLTREAADEAVYRETRAREVAVYRKADAVITVTDADAAALLEEYPDICCEVVPNIHQLSLKGVRGEGEGLIFVGGFNHDPNVDAVLYFCAEILPLIRKRKPDITFTIVGGNPPDEILRLADGSVRVTGHVPETSSYLHSSRVSVAPLRYGAGMKGKIGEAMAHGIPVVTTSIGAQGMGLTNRKDIMLADSPQAFAAAVIELLDDRQLHEMIRKNAARIIEEHYTPRQVARVMLAALERIGGKSARKMTLPGKISFYNGYITNWVKSRLSSG